MSAPRRAPSKPPRRARLGRFVHLLARRYMDYGRAVMSAARRKRGRAVDVDTQPSREGTGWALHWATVGRNKLHDPHGRIHPATRIDTLTDAQVAGLRGPKGQVPQRLSAILRLCNEHDVRAEVEVKALLSLVYLRRLMARWYVAELHHAGRLQFKTLAWMGDPIPRLAAVHDAGGTTILSFTGFGRRKGISKRRAWPVTDLIRGRARWGA